ncbi:MAG: hypothetical protein FJ317_06610 [SAR202 cluster bacterium]|nr:hypothetical protein [SAR202 cluster bacterium]
MATRKVAPLVRRLANLVAIAALMVLLQTAGCVSSASAPSLSEETVQTALEAATPSPIVQSATPEPTATPLPSPTPMPTATPVPTNTPMPEPTATATAQAASTPTATVTIAIPTTVGAGSTVEELIAATRSPDWKTRWDAVNEMGVRQEARGIPALTERALYDDNPHPRWRSLWAISAIDRKAVQSSVAFVAALDDPDPIIVHNAAVALAFFGRAEALPQLLLDLQDSDSYRRWEAVFSLKEVGDSQAAEALRPYLLESNEPAADVRAQTALTLGSIGDSSFVEDLLTTLQEDSAATVRMRAALALGQIKDPTAIPGLEQALASETNSLVIDFIENAIETLQKQK